MVPFTILAYTVHYVHLHLGGCIINILKPSDPQRAHNDFKKVIFSPVAVPPSTEVLESCGI